MQGEWSLMTLAYNVTRVLNLLGVELLRACCAKQMAWPHGAQKLLAYNSV